MRRHHAWIPAANALPFAPRRHLPGALALAGLALPLLAGAGVAASGAGSDAGLCVGNDSSRAHLFAVEASGGARELAMLAPGERLCTPDLGDGGVVSVFEDESHFEGCSRLVAAGDSDSLIRYAEFDRCEWRSHHD